MALPTLRRKDTGALITDNAKSWTGWNVPFGMAALPPLAGGFYLQKTSSGVVQCEVNWRFATRFATSTLDNMYLLIELAQQISNGQGFVFEYRDVEGWVSDVQIVKVPGNLDPDSPTDLQEFFSPLHSYYILPTTLMKLGYIP